MCAFPIDITELAAKQHSVVSYGQVLELGMSRKQIRARIAAGELEAVFPGAFRLPGAEKTFEQTAMAATLACGTGAVASFRTAGILHGVPNLAHRTEVSIPA